MALRLLDLFCGAGGAAMGYHRVGFTDIVGVDIVPQKNYPFTFIQGDATRPPVDLAAFDLIHASPPCQRFSTATANKEAHPDLIGQVRDLLTGRAYIMENVPSAPLRRDVLLCGSMFGLDVRRHRIFEVGGFDVWSAPVCNHAWKTGRPWSVVGNPGGRKPWAERAQRSETHSHKFYDLAHAQELMEMPWTKKVREVTEAIPPAYTEYLGRQFVDQMART